MQFNNGLENHQISSQELDDKKRYFKRRRTHIWELVISSTEFLYFEIRFLKLKHHNDEIKISVLGLIPTSAFIYKHTNIFYISIDHLSFSKLAGIHADCDCSYSSSLSKTIWELKWDSPLHMLFLLIVQGKYILKTRGDYNKPPFFQKVLGFL